MKLVTVGTGTVSPHPRRASASHWVEVGQRGSGEVGKKERDGFPTAPLPRFPTLLMDCGAGTVHGLARHGLPWQSITHVAITHFHADHLGELPALLFAMKYGAMETRTAPLTIIGPRGLRHRLDGFAQALGDWVTAPGFSLDVREIFPSAQHPTPGTQLVSGITLSCCKTPHTDESLAFAVETSEARLVYTGDTGPSEALGDWARGCDALLAECSLPDDRAMDIHLTPTTAGALAARAQAKTLILTHLYPPVETVDIAGIAGKFYGGPVVVAQDGMAFTIGEALKRSSG
jgi:ribonuclease BN (tRNA processing enzyme)